MSRRHQPHHVHIALPSVAAPQPSIRPARRGSVSPILLLALALIVLLALVGGGIWWIAGGGTTGDADSAAGATADRITIPAGAGGAEAARTFEGREAALKAVDEYLQTEQLGQAEVIIQALLERDADDLLALDRLTEVLLSESRNEEALRVLVRIVELDPENAPARFRTGLVANMVGDLEVAIEQFRQASLIDRSNPQYPLYLAQMYVKSQELEEAKTRLLQAIALDPSLDKAWGTLAQIALLQNNPEMARQHIGRARQLNPDYLLWKVEEAKVMRRLNEPRDALAMLNALPASQRHEPLVVEQIGLCWAMINEPQKAAEAHVELLNRDPSQWPSAVAASRFYLVAGDESQAIYWLHFAQRLAPDEPEVQSLARMIDPAGNNADADETGTGEPAVAGADDEAAGG